VPSIDTTRKELPGDLDRDGVIETREPSRTNDHDVVRQGGGVPIPHGLDDAGRTEGVVPLSTSHGATGLACDGGAWWWERRGRGRYPRAKNLLPLCDGGGSTSASKDVFKEDLQEPATRLGPETRVGHDPPTAPRTGRASTVCWPP
jgi:hypothetical protein